jgi:hypothetical protein
MNIPSLENSTNLNQLSRKLTKRKRPGSEHIVTHVSTKRRKNSFR